MGKFLKKLLGIGKNENGPEKVPPAKPLPEIPTQEDIDNFPTNNHARKKIADFNFVDSSHHHKEFDPKKYTAPILSNKCTQGTGMVDDTHSIRKQLCRENNIKYSGYHFYECRRDPVKQAEFYVKQHGPFSLPPQADFETYEAIGQDDKMLIANIEKFYLFLVEVERLTGMTPWIYVNYAFAKKAKFPAKFGRFFAWFARYNSFLGDIPAPWTKDSTAAWQFTDKGVFPGFKGGNDVNVYYGNVNALNLE